jgi:formylglycine-generating enzyme required for sulfatase activity
MAGAIVSSVGLTLLGGCSTEPSNLTELSVTAENDAGVDAARVFPASATNSQKDGDETDVDCGGLKAPACADSLQCTAARDCRSQVCSAGTCAVPTFTDRVKNGDETDIDCGGSKAPTCADSKRCATASDCLSASCTGNVCQTATSSDRIKNGGESGIDCGGTASNVPRCAATDSCTASTDCISMVCAQGSCQAPTSTDGVKNGNESDVDCGGTNTGAPKCDTARACASNSDCKSDGCDYENRCAERRSCTRQFGGDTCGSGEIGEPGAVHESCCKTVALTNGVARLDKYHVTAGRMRAFLTRVGGNARAFVDGVGAPRWNVAWSPFVPSTLSEADTFLGPYWLGAVNQFDLASAPVSKRSCNSKDFGGHTYWTPVAAGGDASDYTQNELDPKALNCVGWHLAKAFCAWDGGRLPSRAEIANAYTNNGTTARPWEFVNTPAYVETAQDPRLNHQFSYGYPGNPRRVNGTVQDIAWHISPPGRHPAGANANGAQDIAGNLLHWTNDYEYMFTWTGSWERHGGAEAPPGNWNPNQTSEAPNGYYALGFRCAYD